MKQLLGGLLFVLVGLGAYGAGDVVSAVEAVVTHVDSAAKTLTVKTEDGTEHTFHLLKRTTVKGEHVSDDAAKDTWHGVSEGTNVVVHYSKKGGKDTAEEVDRLGNDGLKETKGTVSELDRGGKKLVVKTDSGAEETYDLSDHAAHDAGHDIAEGAEKGTKVTVYYSEEGGRKVAHFFKKAI